MKNINTMASKLLIILAVIAFTNTAGITKSKKMSGVKRIKGATIESVQKEKKLEGIGTFSNIIIGKFKATPEQRSEYKYALEQFRNSIITDLNSKKVFAKVMSGKGSKASGKTVLVTGEVLGIKIVDSEVRRRKGAWAGKSSMDIYLKLTNASTGKVLKEIIIATYNNPAGAAWSGGNTDRSMPDDMGKIISAYIATVIPTK